MLDLAAAVVREKERESFSGEELRAYDESAAKELLESELRAPRRNERLQVGITALQ